MPSKKTKTNFQKIPNTIIIGSSKIDVKVVRKCSSDAMGTFARDDLLIQISEKYLPKTIPNTLLHEILHACWAEYGLPLDGEAKEEVVVNCLTNALTSVMTHNPELRDYFNKQWSKK